MSNKIWFNLLNPKPNLVIERASWTAKDPCATWALYVVYFFVLMCCFVLPFALVCGVILHKTQTYHGRVGSERLAERPGGVGQDWVPTELFAQKAKVTCIFQGVEKKVASMSFQKDEQKKTIFRQTKEQNQRLTRD